MQYQITDILDKAGQTLLIEQENGKQYIVRGVVSISTTDRQLGKASQFTEAQSYNNVACVQFIPIMYGIKPKANGYLCTIIDKKINAEYTIETIEPIVFQNEVIGYNLYCNDQEVTKYAKG